ncbi:MAG: general secretion pathway protein GspK, partial [Spirochaetia bacterium]|nr:general secretion pathway protein GspK [Spirochaetia bacterium]
MKIPRFRDHISRRGMMAVMMTFSLGAAANSMAVQFWSDSQDQYAATRVLADGFRARQQAMAGFMAGLTAIKSMPEEYLYKSGLALNPPDILISKECLPRCYLSYRLIPEDGKLNLNHLVHGFDDKVNEQYKQVFDRFFRQYEIPVDGIDAIIDWIDENDNIEGRGAERHYYEGLNPPRKIKNFRMFSLSEVTQVKGIEWAMIYQSRAPKGWAEMQRELKFQTEDEKNLITAEDWIPSNNLTAYVSLGDRMDDKVNINAARYHVLMSLSDAMTRDAVLALFKRRREKGGYIKDVGELQSLPQFQRQTSLGVTLYAELVGTGGQLSGLI